MLDINYMRLKRTLLKNFRNANVYIEIKGILNTRYRIEKSRILINKHRIVISNEDIDCMILLDFIKKVKIDEKLRIELNTENSQYILEI